MQHNLKRIFIKGRKGQSQAFNNCQYCLTISNAKFEEISFLRLLNIFNNLYKHKKNVWYSKRKKKIVKLMNFEII